MAGRRFFAGAHDSTGARTARAAWTLRRGLGQTGGNAEATDDDMRTPFPLRLLALGLVLATAFAWAAPGTYTGTAPVNSQSDDERAEALKTALANVVIEQSGDGGALSRPEVAKAVAQADRYVQQYEYRTNANADAGGARLTLVAQFDSAAVDKMLQRLGLGGADVVAAASETPSEATVWIGGLRNADDYARVIAYLGRSNFVRGAQPMRARGDGMLVKLSLATDLAHFLDAVGMERTLAVASQPASADHVDATLALVR
jgi:hypothetical protein